MANWQYDKAINALQKIDNDYSEIIKDSMVHNLVNIHTGADSGCQVDIQLSTKFDYPNDIIEYWKTLIGADRWYINVKRNQLSIHYQVHYNLDKVKGGDQ